VLRLLRGQITRKDWMLLVLAALFIMRFIYMGK
jgi:adenine/guanine/hypoxanthine permease